MNTPLNGHTLDSVKSFVGNHLHLPHTVSRNVNELHASQLSVGERMADHLAEVAGSWRFLGLFFAFLAVWAIGNAFLLGTRAFDPYPFILLNLLLSLLAGVQVPIIMMSQNRQEAKDRLRAENDYQVNLKAELEVAQLHQKLDLLRETQWQELIDLQRRQIELLEHPAVRGSRAPAPEPGSAERIMLPRRRRKVADADGTAAATRSPNGRASRAELAERA